MSIFDLIGLFLTSFFGAILTILIGLSVYMTWLLVRDNRRVNRLMK